VEPRTDGVVRFSFAISMGVRRKDAELRALLDGVLERKRADIAALLARYGVPNVGAAP
jgi:mxaJ protein